MDGVSVRARIGRVDARLQVPGNRHIESHARSVRSETAVRNQTVDSHRGLRFLRNHVDRSADGAFAVHQRSGAFQNFDTIENECVDGPAALRTAVLANTVAHDGNVVAAPSARRISGNGTDTGARDHSNAELN